MTHGTFHFGRCCTGILSQLPTARGSPAVYEGMTATALSPAAPLFAPLSAAGLRGFLRGTRLMTVDGPMPVEEIAPGEAVLDPEGRPHFVLWQGGCDLHPASGRADDPSLPVRIAANAFGPGLPRRDLFLSQQHRVQVETAAGLLTARAGSLRPPMAQIVPMAGKISYHAVVTRNPCLLMAENLPCESLRPEGREGMTAPSDPCVASLGVGTGWAGALRKPARDDLAQDVAHDPIIALRP